MRAKRVGELLESLGPFLGGGFLTQRLFVTHLYFPRTGKRSGCTLLILSGLFFGGASAECREQTPRTSHTETV